VFTPLNLATIAFELFVLVLVISLHDFAQAWAANRLGDPTARMLGRLTMNPAKHFDPWGTVVWPLLFIFRSPLVLGWGKPVPMTFRNFRARNGEMLAILAGPAAQLLAAVVALVMLIVLKHLSAGAGQSLGIVDALAFRVPLDGLANLPAIFPLLLFLYLIILVSLLLFCFNLIPMPFLDGGRILSYFLPYNAQRAFEQYSFYFMIAFFFIGFRLIMIGFAPLLAIFDALLNQF
jgi:Zn-dependent protease